MLESILKVVGGCVSAMLPEQLSRLKTTKRGEWLC